jgi:outer membrane protein insertion porin family
MLDSDPAAAHIAINVQVDEGSQYRLGTITFRHNEAISSVAVLRSLFPIRDGDVFSREKLATGLDNLRKAYGQLGYINFTSIPNTVVDNEEGLISLDIDVDEGKKFYVSSVKILGLDETSQEEILQDFPAGQLYDQRLFELFLEKYPAIFKFSPDDPRPIEKRLDERAGTVAITIDARPCQVN